MYLHASLRDVRTGGGGGGGVERTGERKGGQRGNRNKRGRGKKGGRGGKIYSSGQ